LKGASKYNTGRESSSEAKTKASTKQSCSGASSKSWKTGFKRPSEFQDAHGPGASTTSIEARMRHNYKLAKGSDFNRNSDLEQAETLSLIEPHLCENVPVEVGEPYG
jgi:hypothetical protein